MKWSVGKILSKWATLSPEKSAIIYEDTPISYRMLNEEANRISNFLKDSGLKKGDRIALDLYNCPEFLSCYFAAAKLGLILVPLNYRHVARELAYQINNCGCRLLIFHDELQANVAQIVTRVSVEKDKFIRLRSDTAIDNTPPQWAIDFHKTIGGYSTREPVPDTPVDLDDPLLILYTSGVTGDPKGAVISHGQTFFKNFQIIIHTDMREADVFLSQSPLCHSAGLAAAATPALCRGSTLLMRKKFDAEQFGRDIERYRATIVFGLTTMFRFVLDTGVLDRIDLSSVRVLLGGGERTPDSLFDALAQKGLYLQMGFGQTENSGMTLMPKSYVQKKKGACGLPNFFTEVWVENSKGETAAPGEIGDVVAAGPNVMSGYWQMPEATASTIVYGKLYTGDLGYKDSDGFLYIVDRAKQMYRSGAENVYPAEVERVLAGHPKIECVAVIGVPDEKWGESGKAFIAVKSGHRLTRQEIIAFLDGKIARYKYPKTFHFYDALPITGWGKVKKVELKRWIEAGDLSAAE